ncbi:MAG: FecR domain-containing protein [Paucimonas sp.]|jgi:transmembrane sensor|nr:FecR domain-containing protein [Paucimonas sp.]
MSLEPPISAEQSAAALRWLGRINQQPDEADGAAFKRWLLQDPAHRRAYAEAEALWRLSAAPAARLAEEQHDSLRPYLAAMRRPAAPRPWRRYAVAACLVLGLGGLGGWQPRHWIQDLRADYSSGAQPRQVRLADQSRLTLDADTALTVDFAHGERRVRLLRGAAYFEVSHTGAPFLVDAKGGEVRVLGTRFEVREQDTGARVTVSSGRVAVSPGQGGAPRELQSDQQLAYADGVAGVVEAVDSAGQLAWRQGWLSYHQVPLGQVVEDLGRYYPGRILLLDGELAQRRVSGSFLLNEPLAALDSLGKVLGFERHTVLGRLTVLR